MARVSRSADTDRWRSAARAARRGGFARWIERASRHGVPSRSSRGRTRKAVVLRPARGARVRSSIPRFSRATANRATPEGIRFEDALDEALAATPVIGTAANVHDINVALALLHGKETDVYADAGYQGIEKRCEADAVRWHVAMRPAKRRKLDLSDSVDALLKRRQVEDFLNERMHPSIAGYCTLSNSSKRAPGCRHRWSQSGVRAGLRVQLDKALGAPGTKPISAHCLFPCWYHQCSCLRQHPVKPLRNNLFGLVHDSFDQLSDLGDVMNESGNHAA
ncbi:hypothetical protein OKW46_006022 [Paraburkholderia sp. WSM4179]|nr:hypothetical protein [Paraburkholderia sp. WSM4179]